MPDLLAPSSRRSFARLIGFGAAYAALDPFSTSVRAASTPTAAPAAVPAPLPWSAGAGVRLSANENPYGPPPAALVAMQEAAARSCRYPDDGEDLLREALARLHGVPADSILLGNGSSQILHAAAAASAVPGARVITADPTFEALAHYATKRDLEVVRVPLTAQRSHDLEAMLAAVRGADLVYVCNPNNPTATVTPAPTVRAFLDRLPATAAVVVDEAYHHYALDSPGYESVVPLIAGHPNLIVARTFSKIYGMAGLRCGYAIASPDRVARMRDQMPWDSMNLMALTAARAALADTVHLERSRRLNAEILAWTCAAIEKAGARVLPSAANFFMAELGSDVGPVIQGMKARGVEVGRRFAALPTHLRVTVGTEAEMRAFVAAFERVVAGEVPVPS